MVINYREGGATKWEEGQVKFYPNKKKRGGGSGKVHPEGGGEGEQKRVGVVLTWVLEVLTILQGGAKGFLHLKGGGARKKCFTMS